MVDKLSVEKFEVLSTVAAPITALACVPLERITSKAVTEKENRLFTRFLQDTVLKKKKKIKKKWKYISESSKVKDVVGSFPLLVKIVIKSWYL